jgi:hypothetical protein
MRENWRKTSNMVINVDEPMGFRLSLFSKNGMKTQMKLYGTGLTVYPFKSLS